MAGSSRRRQVVLIGSLAVSLGLTAWVTVNDAPAEDLLVDPVPPATERKRAVVNDPVRRPVTTLPVLARPLEEERTAPPGNLFEVHAWTVPPPVAPAPGATPEPPPKPVAPAVPYAYLGKLEDMPDGTLFMLSANNKVYTVKPGEVIDRVWRLDKEDAASLHFTYLPLTLAKTLSKAARLPVMGQNNNPGAS